MKEEKHKCSLCGHDFKSKEALEMHKRAKHPHKEEEKHTTKEKPKVGINFKRLRNWIISIAIIVIIIWGLYSLINSGSFGDAPITEINIDGYNNLVIDMNTHLEINIDENPIEIPSSIGIQPGITRPLHTHDSTGDIHIASLYPRDFTLGEFFQVWGMTFNESCILEHCTIPGVGAMEMFVNGEKSESYDRLNLRDGDEILIEYHSF